MNHALRIGLAIFFCCCTLADEAGAHLGERAKLLPSDGLADDRFGTSVDVDGKIAVVGSPFHLVGSNRGAVYVYQSTSQVDWPEVAMLTPTGAGPLDEFGAALSLDGAYLAVSAPRASSDTGAVYIFTGSGSNWSQTQVLTASDAGPTHLFGRSLDLEGDTLTVGAPGNEAAYVFRLVAGTWVEEQKLAGAAGMSGDLFGESVALFGDELVVGAPQEDTDGLNAGSAYLFERSGSTWTPTFRFGSATPGAGDLFGASVCIGQIYVGVGAPLDDDTGLDSGAAHYFSRDGAGGWISEGTLVSISAPTAAGDHVGQTMVVDTDLFTIGAPDGDLQGTGSGGMQTFQEHVGIFYGDVVFPSDNTAGNELGASIGISGCWLIGGAPRSDDLGADSGSAYLFHNTPLLTLYCLPGISGKGCAATLSPTGTASATSPVGFNVIADGVESGITGVYFYGTNGMQQAPWGNGTSFQCVVPPVIRMGVITSSGPSGVPCAGQFMQDLNAVWCPTCPSPAKNPGAGSDIYLQLWYRDPTNTSNQTTSLSNAASLGVCP